MKVTLIGALLLLLSLTCLAAPPWASYTLTNFADEFEGASYDKNVWSVYNNRTNLTVSGGCLHLNTIERGTNYTAGGLYTKQFEQRFGYYETRMQVGGDTGLNNAFWINSATDYKNGYDQLEIDIVEAHYNDDINVGVHDWKPVHQASGKTIAVTNIYPGFHTSGLEWTRSGSLNWYWDGALVRTMSAASLNAYQSMCPMNIIFSTLVLTDGFAGPLGTNLDGTHMDVDYVRVWQKPGWGGDIDTNWAQRSNWGPDGIPGAGDAAIFNRGATNTTLSFSADQPVKELYFNGPACPSMTFAAGSHLLLGALDSGSGIGGITINRDVMWPQTINVDITAQNDLVFANLSTAPGVKLELNGALSSSASNRTVYLTGAGPVRVNGGLSSQIGDVIHFGGEAWLTASNAHTGVSLVTNGTLVITANGALGATGGGGQTTVQSGATLALAAGVNYSLPEPVFLSGAGQSGRQGALDLYDGSSVSFAGSVTLTGDASIGSGGSYGTLKLLGTLDTVSNAFTLTFRGYGSTLVSAPIIGPGKVIKSGNGTVTLSAANSFSGGCTIQAGTLNLAGSLAGPVVVAGGVLSGSGRIDGDLTVNGGVHAPGSSPGAMVVRNNYTLNSGGTLRVEILGTTPGTQYDQIQLPSAESTVTLAGALDLVAAPNLPVGANIVIITNAGPTAVAGTFAGLTEGQTFAASGYWWRITYAGGDGNDVVLTSVPPPVSRLSMAVSHGVPWLTFTGPSNLNYQVQASTNLVNWSAILTTNPMAMPLTWSETNVHHAGGRFYRVLLDP